MPMDPGAKDQFDSHHSIVIGDSRNLGSVEKESVDLVVTSPPYPMIAMWDPLFSSLEPGIADALSAQDGMGAFHLMHAELSRTWKEVDRVLKPDRFACVNIGDAVRTVGGRFRLFPNHARTIDEFLRLGFTMLPSILWRKTTNKPNKFMGSGMLPAGAYATLEHEFILIFRKGGPRRFSEAEREVRARSAVFWEERNAWFSDVWAGIKGVPQRSGGEGRRTAAFPLDVPYRLISMYSILGDTILDPFLGTGTSTVAAMCAGRSSVGFEKEPGMVEKASSRLCRAPDIAKEMLRSRLHDHVLFMQDRMSKKAPPRYRSTHYGFPVVTRQEVDIRLPLLTKVGLERKGSFKGSYGPPNSFPS